MGRAVPYPASTGKLHCISYWLFHVELSLTSMATGKLNATGRNHPGPFRFYIWNAQGSAVAKWFLSKSIVATHVQCHSNSGARLSMPGVKLPPLAKGSAQQPDLVGVHLLSVLQVENLSIQRFG